VINIKISWIRSSVDKKSFKIFKNIGLDVVELDNLEDTDLKIKELVESKYSYIVVSSEVAGFSEDIIKKYKKNEGVNIIIASSKRE
jgi:hypothetical protein